VKNKNKEILKLAEEILKNLELNEIPLGNVILKCMRLARLSNDQESIKLFNYEINGYPKDDKGYVLAEAFTLARQVNRVFRNKNKSSIMQDFMFPETVNELASSLELSKQKLGNVRNKEKTLPSQNILSFDLDPTKIEIAISEGNVLRIEQKINQLKSGYYSYVLSVYYEYKFGTISESIFNNRKINVDKFLLQKIPDSVKKFISIYDNLSSGNEEDWANAVHSCRRILADVADYLYPPSDEVIKISKTKEIKLDSSNYIARIKQYIRNKTSSESFTKIVGSHLDYIEDRIDSVYKASSKGTHAKVTKEEAERYVIYTYLLLSDILSL
jgi:hypothetical protein